MSFDVADLGTFARQWAVQSPKIGSRPGCCGSSPGYPGRLPLSRGCRSPG
jgi:hypothetical protein